MSKEITGYELSRQWFDWCFENPELINPNHTALYFFCIEHCNRLGWKEKFGLPMEMAKDAIGIKNYKTYSKTFEDLIEWGFIKLLQKSKNQYSSNIIAIVKNTKAHTKALSKATQKHSQKQVHGIVGIDKQIQTNTEPITSEQEITEKEDGNILIILPTEIQRRLIEDEYQVMEFVCRSYGFSESNYSDLVKLFVGEKTSGKNELEKEYSEVIGQFKSWVKYHRIKLLSQFTEHGKQTRKGQPDIEGITGAAEEVLRKYNLENHTGSD